MRHADSRKVTKKAVRTQHQILHAALELFKEKGFDNTTMREVAESAELSVGSTYYYFKTKEELVLAFYVESCGLFSERADAILSGTKDFKTRLTKILEERFEQLRPYRNFLTGLMRNAIDPRSELSPFSPVTKQIRDDAIAVFAKVIEGSTLKVTPRLRTHLPRLLWLYHLGLVLYWTYDQSENDKKSRRLIDGTVGIIATGLKIANLPLMGTLLKPGLDLFEDLSGLPE